MDFGQQRNPSKHVVGIGVVLGLHLLLGWALVSGLAQRMVEVIKAPIETKLIEEVKPPPPPPPENLPPPPKFAPPPPSYIPPPEVVVNRPPAPAPVITTTTVAPPPTVVTVAPAPAPVAAPPAPPAPPPPPPPPPRRAAQPAIANVSACAPKSEDYPPAALRAEATGTTRVRFEVDASGKLSKADVVKPSGTSREHRLLDRVALNKLSECSFRAGNDETGKAVGGVFEVEYVWKIE